MAKSEYSPSDKEFQWDLAAICVRRLYCGMHPDYRKARLMSVFQAFIDESGDKSAFILAGLIAPVAIWQQIAIHWINVCKAPPPIEYYKTHDAIICDGAFKHFGEKDRDRKVAELAGVIPLDKCYAISVYLPVQEFKDIQERYADVVEKTFPLWENRRLLYNDPYFIAASCLSTFIALMDCDFLFPEIITKVQIDLIFDDKGKIGRQFEYFHNNLL